MENEERGQLEVQHQKEVDNLREESGKATHIAQPEPMPVNPVNPQNRGQMGCHLIFNKPCISNQHTP